MPAVRADYPLKRGDSNKWDVICSRGGAPVPLFGAVCRMYAKVRVEDPDSAAVFKLDSAGLGGIVIMDAGNGWIRITAPPAQTLGLTSSATLVYDIEVTEADGTVTTVVEGLLIVSLDVTQA